MNLYRLILVTPTGNVNRGVWANDMIVKDGVYYFRNTSQDPGQEYELVASYPINITLITNIETKEEYDAKKEKADPYMNYSTTLPPRK